jgi:hypothetical protein
MWQQGLVDNICNPADGDKQLWMNKVVALYKKKCFLWA